MIQNKRQLVDAIKAAGLPQNLLKIWDGDVPVQLRYTLQDPSSFFEAFLMHPEGFPSPDELVILWQTNGESIVGYLSVTGIFIRNYLEDGPDDYDVLGSTYQQMLGDLFSKLIMREVPDQELAECVDFLDFRYLPQLQGFMAHNPDWETNTIPFIAGLEASASPPDSDSTSG